MLVFEGVELSEGLVEFQLFQLFFEVDLFFLGSAQLDLKMGDFYLEFLAKLCDWGEDMSLFFCFDWGDVFLEHGYSLGKDFHFDFVGGAALS